MMRAVIIDDAPLTRQGIRMYLKNETDVEIVGEAADGPDAVSKILSLRPDLIFLDIQMPGFGGFDVLDRTRGANIGAVIFITAHSDYALQAFANDAVSYLLKPIEPKRFAMAVDRARRYLQPRDRAPGEGAAVGESIIDQGVTEGVAGAQLDAGRSLARILIRHADRFLLVKAEEIRWISAAAEYATLHTERGDWLVRMSISDLASRLSSKQFARIHRSTIVNLDQIREIQPRSHGDYDVILHDNTELRLTRSYRASIFGSSD
jgi:two-component system LytT family response regulator